MIANPIYSDHFFVEVSDLHTIQENGNIELNLPDKTEREFFVGKEIRYQNANDYVFYAELEDPSDTYRMGYLHLIAKNGNVFGQINIEEEVYELHDFGEHKNVIFKIDLVTSEGTCGASIEHKENLEKEITYADEGENLEPMLKNDLIRGCNVRVLFLFTNAANEMGDPEDKATLFLEQTNQSVCNSKANVHFTLAGIELLENFNEEDYSNDAEDALADLPTNLVANQLRAAHYADLVVVLTDGDWFTIGMLPSGTEIETPLHGIAPIEEWGNKDFGYNIVEMDVAGAKLICPHEIGHHFGCKHENDDEGAPNFVFDARGYRFKTGIFPFRTRRLTVMSREQFKVARIMHYSNPQVNFKNKPTGVIDERENEDQLSNEACNIASYTEPPPPSLIANIVGPKEGDNGGAYTWCVEIDNCDTPDAILWEYGLDGFTFFPWPDGEDETCVEGSLPTDNGMWLRVTVICGDDTYTDWHLTTNQDDIIVIMPKRTEEEQELYVEMSDEARLINLNVYPNPLNNQFSVELELDSKQRVDIQLIDLTGKIVLQLSNEQIEAGVHKMTYYISNLNKGFYFVNAKIGNNTITKSILKL